MAVPFSQATSISALPTLPVSFDHPTVTTPLASVLPTAPAP